MSNIKGTLAIVTPLGDKEQRGWEKNSMQIYSQEQEILATNRSCCRLPKHTLTLNSRSEKKELA